MSPRPPAAAAVSPPLFDLEAYRCEPHPLVRMKDLARRHRPPSLSARMRREEENHAAIEKLRSIGSELAAHFRLRYVLIEAERDGVNEHYGVCYKDGVIRIRLRHATTGRLLKESSLVDTLCHELAHLRHFDHSPRFRRFYWKVLEKARERGHYRPGPEMPVMRQLSLFDDWACGVGARPRRPRGAREAPVIAPSRVRHDGGSR